jgi:hypothetical protein
MSGAWSRGQQGTTAAPSGQLCSGLDQRRRLGPAAFTRACRIWHARGQGFKSPQLHPRSAALSGSGLPRFSRLGQQTGSNMCCAPPVVRRDGAVPSRSDPWSRRTGHRQRSDGPKAPRQPSMSPRPDHDPGKASPPEPLEAPSGDEEQKPLVGLCQVGARVGPVRRSQRGAGRLQIGQAPAQHPSSTCNSSSSCHKLRPTPPVWGGAAAPGSRTRGRPTPRSRDGASPARSGLRSGPGRARP